MGTVVFGYWKIRGLGQYLRHLLTYTGIKFTEVQYESREKWFDGDKKNLGLEFPNLPYLIDGEYKLTESSAIARYIIQRSGKTQLLGRDLLDETRLNNLIGVFNDAFKEIQGLFFNKNYEALKIESLEKAKPKLDYIKSFVGDKPFALGYLTIIDFILAETLYYFESLYPNERKNYTFWWRIRQNFQRLPEIQAYYQRHDAIMGPFLSPDSAVHITPKKVIFGYWNIRGIAQTQRLLLAYSGVDFEERIYKFGQKQKWFNEDKMNLELDFPNVPYLLDGNTTITETTAIQKYIIKRWGKLQLLGRTIEDRSKIESFLSVFMEISGQIKRLFINKEYLTAKIPVFEKYNPKLLQLNDFVGKKDFVIGYLTLADFCVAEQSRFIEIMYPKQYKNWPFLQRIRERFDKLPEIINYYKKPTAFNGNYIPPEIAALKIEKQ